MKKTVNVNLGGRVFQIDDDAYRMLETYIQNIRALYLPEDPEGEIVEDFEQRLSDLLWEKKYGEEAVITVQMTEEAIRQLGPLEDIKADESFGDEPKGEEEGYASAATSGYARGEEPSGQAFGQISSQTSAPRMSERKKFFRNPEDKWIAGVLGGLGALMGIDPLFLRILFVLLMFTPVNWILLILYVTFWIFIPKAKTVEDRLRMEGRPVSSSEIWNKISEEAAFAAGAASDGLSRMSKAFSRNTESQDAATATPKKKTPNDSLVYWVLGIAVLLVLALSVYWLFDFVGSGTFMYPETWDIDFPDIVAGGLAGGGILVALVMVLVAIVFAFAAIFLLFVLPLGLIIRSNMNGGLKVVLCLIWLVILGLVTV